MRFNNNLEEISNFLDQAFQLNITYIESCNFYIDNNCEQLLGKALKKYSRNSFQLAAKLCYKHINHNNFNFEQYFQTQLKNLQTNYIDFYLLQAIDRFSFKNENQLCSWFQNYYNFLLNKQKQGIIKYIGFSFHDTSPYLETLLKNFKWDFCQLQLNYYDWYLGDAKNLYFLTEKYNIPIIVMGGLKGGTLGETNNLNPELAYKFLNTLPNVKLILNGSNNIIQLIQNENIINSNIPLTKSELNTIKQEYLPKLQSYINCTGCKYCNNICPNQLKIWEIFQNYNQALRDNNTLNYLENIKSKDNHILQCVGCQKCELVCPQHLPIATLMYKKIFQLRL